MNRRQFLAALGTAATAAAVAPYVPALFAPVTPVSLAIHPAVVAAAPVSTLAAAEGPTGISMRFIKQFDLSQPVTRFDVIYGWGAMRDVVCRVEG